VLGARAQLFQKVDPGNAEPVFDKIRRRHLVSGCAEDLRDGTFATGGFPDGAIELLDRQQGACCFGRGRIELIREATRDVAA